MNNKYELKCNNCGVEFNGEHECNYELLKEQSKRQQETYIELDKIWNEIYDMYRIRKTEYTDGVLDGLEIALEHMTEVVKEESE